MNNSEIIVGYRSLGEYMVGQRGGRARSRVQIWRDIKAGRFPAPIELGPNSVAWFRKEVDANLAARPRRTYRASQPEAA